MADAISGLTFDVINLVIALIGLFGGLPHLLKWMKSPNIKIIDCKILRFSEGPSAVYDDHGQIIGQEWEPSQSMVTWRIKNKRRLWVFGSDNAPNLLTKFTFWRVDEDAPRDYKWAGDKTVWPLLSIGQEHPDTATFTDYYLPFGHYKLTLVFYSSEKILGSDTRFIIFNEKNRRRWTKEYFLKK